MALNKILEGLGLTETAQKVFSDLLENGPSLARQTAQRLDIPRPSVYDHFKILINKGLVTEKSVENKKVFAIDDIKGIPDLLDEKIKSLSAEKIEFEKMLPDLIAKSGFIEPQVKFYTGADGIKQVINHIMQNRDIETYLMWPMSEMMKVLGPEYLEEINIKRIKRNISLKVIWPKDKKLAAKDYPYLGSGKELLRELRFAPKDMTWDMGYWMYQDRVAFLSSQKEGFGFVVNSRDFATLIKVQFDQIWKICEIAKSDDNAADKFLSKPEFV